MAEHAVRQTLSDAGAQDPAIGSPGPDDASLRMIRRCPLFASLSAAGLRDILAIGQVRGIARQEAVFRQGDRADRIYVLVLGRIKLFLGGPGGRGIILAFVDPGEAFGYLAPLAGTIRAHAAVAVTESLVMAWDAQAFEDLLRRYPAILSNALRLTARRIQADWSRLHALVTEPVGRRLARALLRLARADRHGKAPVVSMLQQDLAEFLGTTPRTLSRILGKWEARGLVAAGRERVVVLRPAGLLRLAQLEDAAGPPGQRRG